ncbi:autotransporter outer membrane beta-barrel domain-containing protein [Pseudomonas sp. TMB3-21]
MSAFFFMSCPAWAATIVDNGATLDVDSATTPVTDYLVRNNSTLNVQGALTESIRVTSGSALNLNDAMVNGQNGGIGVAINSSSAAINRATVNSDSTALLVNRPNASTQGSTVTAADSEFNGGETGAAVSGLSTLELINSQATGTTAGSHGVDIFGGAVRATARTHISGDVAGVVMVNDPAQQGNASLFLDNSTVEGRNGAAIIIDQGVDATITVSNNSTLIGSNGNLLEVQGASAADMDIVNSRLQGNVQITGNSTASLMFDRAAMAGDIVREEGSLANVVLNNGSSFTGRLNGSNLALNESDLTMVDNDRIDTLSLNDGTVNFGVPGEQRAARQLDVVTLSGSGTIAMQGNFATGERDLLTAATATGSFDLEVNASGKDAADPQPLTLVQIERNQATFSLLGGRVNVGTWDYELAERTNTDGGTEYYLNPTTRLSPGAQSVVALFQTALTVSYGELKSLENRMGELQSDANLNGLWIRPYGNEYKVADGSGVGYSQQQQGLSLGVDTRLGHSQWRVGLMGGYSQSDLSLDGGTSADVDSYYFGPYFSWSNPDNGDFLDGALKFNHLRNESKVSMSDGQRAKGDYSNSAVSALLEGGRLIDLGNDWFAKPSVQLSAAVIQGGNYRLDNDMQADSDRTHSLRTKLGVSAGRSVNLGSMRVRPYGRVAMVHEFASNDNVRVNGNTLNTDLSGSGFEVGTGMTVSVSDNMRFDAGVDYAKGKNIEQPVAVTLGMSYQW